MLLLADPTLLLTPCWRFRLDGLLGLVGSVGLCRVVDIFYRKSKLVLQKTMFSDDDSDNNDSDNNDDDDTNFPIEIIMPPQMAAAPAAAGALTIPPELVEWNARVARFHDALWKSDSSLVIEMLAGDVAAPAAFNSAVTLLDSEWPAPHGRLRRPLMVSADVGDRPLAEYLLTRGCSPNQANSVGVTALFVAAQEGRTPVVDLLLCAGADVNAARLLDGATPLLLAAQHGNDDACRLLVACEAQVNRCTTNHGSMPIYSAAYNNRRSTLTMLIAAGADVNQVTRGAISTQSLYLAAWKDLREIGAILVVAGATLSALERQLLSSALRPDRFAAWQLILDGQIPQSERDAIVQSLEAERAKLQQVAVSFHWARLRTKLIEICIGLESLDLPALLTCMIFEMTDQFTAILPMIKSWKVATHVKHRLDSEEKSKRR
jgi:hypothetical protein